ncbi:MAG: undecaprenyl/decaprenyl-phosphate alpha-N-acetylglucosaminyl 1-phosphate transferase [Bacteroides sp.]|nr:undecaprenyl/decaprenyl-phosphate alpha-N-acetylglucosaminyl 1-phosphate transferase [Bacteroides sp.]
MEHWLLNNFLTLGLAFLMTGILIPQILVIAFRKKLFDGHDERKIHHGAVPRLGGIAFVPAIIFSVLAVIGVDLSGHSRAMMFALEEAMVPLLFLICSLMLLFLIGIADDLIGIRYSAKFFFQLLAAALIIAAGVWIDDLYGLLWIHILPYDWMGWGLTALVVVYVVNSFNLIDGIDGLAAGLAAIALGFYAIVFYLGAAFIYSMIACAAFGSLLPFLYYNLFGSATRGKKIFMGDTGSLSIGMVVVFLAIGLTNFTLEPVSIGEFNPIVMAVAPLLIPMLDSARVFLRRVRKGRNPFMPDRTHIHHKLLDLGLSPTAALAILLAAGIIFLLSNVFLSPYVNINIIFLLDIAVWTVANIMLTRAIRRREQRLQKDLYV